MVGGQPRNIRLERAQQATRARQEAALEAGLPWQMTWSKLRHALAVAVEQSPVPLQIIDDVQTIEIVRPADQEALERRVVMDATGDRRIVFSFSVRLGNQWATCQDPEAATYSVEGSLVRAGGWVRTPTETAVYILRRLQE